MLSIYLFPVSRFRVSRQKVWQVTVISTQPVMFIMDRLEDEMRGLRREVLPYGNPLGDRHDDYYGHQSAWMVSDQTRDLESNEAPR